MEISLKFGCTNEEIKSRIQDAVSEIQHRKSEIKVFSTVIDHYRKQCKHEGQVTGSNERDGAWGNPCPTCGYAY